MHPSVRSGARSLIPSSLPSSRATYLTKEVLPVDPESPCNKIGPGFCSRLRMRSRFSIVVDVNTKVDELFTGPSGRG